MKRINFLIILCFSLGISCFALFYGLGAEVVSDGLLVEPFALIPLGYFFNALGLLMLMFKVFANKK